MHKQESRSEAERGVGPSTLVWNAGVLSVSLVPCASALKIASVHLHVDSRTFLLQEAGRSWQM